MSKIILGITGRSGTGKTCICKIFKKNSFFVINADLVYKELLDKKTECFFDIIDYFSNNILDDNFCIDRKKLSTIVFNDEKELKILNKITHKYIIQSIKEKIVNNKNEKIIIDAPLLFESGLNNICNKTICVISDYENIKKRLKIRDNLTDEEILNRINNQKNDEFLLKNTNYYIINNNDKNYLNDKVKEIIFDILGE